jgi:hypothetical protein
MPPSYPRRKNKKTKCVINKQPTLLDAFASLSFAILCRCVGMLMKWSEERSHPLSTVWERKGMKEKSKREKGITSEIMLRSTPLCFAMQEGRCMMQAVFRSRTARYCWCCFSSRFFVVPDTCMVRYDRGSTINHQHTSSILLLPIALIIRPVILAIQQPTPMRRKLVPTIKTPHHHVSHHHQDPHQGRPCTRHEPPQNTSPEDYAG